ncbi:MAG TPA: hypothetical protein VHC69_09305 [Polyangiaceae bacterium]|nr:hypothetical protein [Polyangiaceae bacterium]
MKVFNQCVFDGYISGTAVVYSDSQYNTLLGNTDQLSVGGYTSQVTGTSPNLTVQVEQSFDNVRWQNRNTSAEIPSTTTLSTTAETNVQGQDGNPTARPTLAFVRLRIALGGTSPAGQVRLWATGRDRGQG